MQTWLPYPNYAACAYVLDDRRLAAQRVEAANLIRACNGVRRNRNLGPRSVISVEDWRRHARESGVPWSVHAAAVMWRNHIRSLMCYFDTVRREWIRRGFENKMHCYNLPYVPEELPQFVGDTRLHSSHRGRLLAKDPTFYARWSWTDEPVEKTWWPNDGDTTETEVVDEDLHDEQWRKLWTY